MYMGTRVPGYTSTRYCTGYSVLYPGTVLYTVIRIVVSYSYVLLYTPLSRIGSCIWPPLHLLDAVVAMRSESRAGPRAIATVIYSKPEVLTSAQCVF